MNDETTGKCAQCAKLQNVRETICINLHQFAKDTRLGAFWCLGASSSCKSFRRSCLIFQFDIPSHNPGNFIARQLPSLPYGLAFHWTHALLAHKCSRKNLSISPNPVWRKNEKNWLFLPCTSSELVRKGLATRNDPWMSCPGGNAWRISMIWESWRKTSYIQTQIHVCSHCLNTCRHWMNIDRWIGTHCISCISLVSLVSYVSYHVSCNEPISSRFIVFGSNTSEFDPSLSQAVLRSLAPDVLSQPRRSKTKSHCRHPPGTNEKLTKQPTPKTLQ